MNRSEHLQPLSHDHHYGLLAARRIMEKLDEGDDTAEIAGFARRLWTDHLSSHFEQEEAHVVPALRAVGAGSRRSGRRLISYDQRTTYAFDAPPPLLRGRAAGAFPEDEAEDREDAP